MDPLDPLAPRDTVTEPNAVIQPRTVDPRPAVANDLRPVRGSGDIVAPYTLPARAAGPAMTGLDFAAGIVTICMICGPLLAGVLRAG